MSVSFLLYVPLLLGLVAAYRCLGATRVMFCRSAWAGTIALLVMPLVGIFCCLETARLMFCRICYPAVSNIRICDPKNIPINQK